MTRNDLAIPDVELRLPSSQQGEIPAMPVPEGPIPIKTATLERLRSLQAQYNTAIDVMLMEIGFERGGCAVDLQRGLIYPPGTFGRNA